VATIDLQLEEPDSLPKPGPIGRLVRFAFGVLSIHYVVGLWSISSDLIIGDGSIRALVWNGVVPTLFLFAYLSLCVSLAVLLAPPGLRGSLDPSPLFNSLRAADGGTSLSRRTLDRH
jgi:hypothetical protein